MREVPKGGWPRTLGQRICQALGSGGGSDWEEECASGPPVRTDLRCDLLDCRSVRVTELREGARAVISCLEAPEDGAGRRLASLGMLPGEEVVLEQTFPAYVLRMGYTELALDRALAERVRVHLLAVTAGG
ncbi:MAG TPA: FeoA family protein [Longimicrobiales bacterium]|nr:FeoA family protein [Longimicrobiales bacterium]